MYFSPMNQIKYKLVLTLTFFLVFFSCTKEIEDIPSIRFIKPCENQYFIVGDTIEIKFDVSSMSNIKSINISLVSDQYTPVSKTYSYSKLNGKLSGQVEFALTIDDLFLPSGNYFIMARVSNEKESKDKFQSINIAAYPRALVAYSLITKNVNTIDVWAYDLSFNGQLQGNMQGDYSGSAYLPFHNRMSIAAKQMGDFTIWDFLSGDTLLNNYGAGNPPFPYFTTNAKVNEYLAVAYYEGKFEFYNYLGRLVYSIKSKSGYFPEYIYDVGTNFVSIEKEKSSSKRILVTHLMESGIPYSFYLLQGSVVAALAFENNDFMMFSNYKSSGQIELFIWDKTATTRPVSYNGDEFIDAVAIGNKSYLILTANEVLWYRYASSSITSMISLSVNNPIKIRFDEINNLIYVVDKQGFSIYKYPTGQLLSDHRLNKEVLNFHLIYNR